MFAVPLEWAQRAVWGSWSEGWVDGGVARRSIFKACFRARGRMASTLLGVLRASYKKNDLLSRVLRQVSRKGKLPRGALGVRARDRVSSASVRDEPSNLVSYGCTFGVCVRDGLSSIVGLPRLRGRGGLVIRSESRHGGLVCVAARSGQPRVLPRRVV